jgi:hypothetical protein
MSMQRPPQRKKSGENPGEFSFVRLSLFNVAALMGKNN